MSSSSVKKKKPFHIPTQSKPSVPKYRALKDHANATVTHKLHTQTQHIAYVSNVVFALVKLDFFISYNWRAKGIQN